MERKWSAQDSADLHLIDRWGKPYFSINEKGHMVCTPKRNVPYAVDIKALVDDLVLRGVQPPLLIRFNDILKSRVAFIASCFDKSIKEYDYKGRYQSIMPIKVNQQRHVVEELVGDQKKIKVGLEAGSKPELLIAMAVLKEENSLLICNGYKDREYIETALDAQRLGLKPFLVLDRYAELAHIISISKKMGIKPNIGIRAKLSSRGTGKWVESSGDRSKFGLSTREIVSAVSTLKEHDMLDCLKLLHFHIGSQITSIRSIKNAIREAGHLYVGLHHLGASNLDHIDVGGGLAIDYDGSQTNFHASMNYSTQEYANDIVSTIQEICEEKSLKHPTLLSESGRALVAHHAVLIFNVLGVNQATGDKNVNLSAPKEEEHAILHTMWEAYTSSSNKKRYQEAYNDAIAAKEESVTLFSHGYIDLETKARVDDLFWASCKQIQRIIEKESYVPEDLEGLNKRMSDIYYCNFSVFQSIPDAWAVRHLFPICPIHRLDEKPTRQAILADLTCDSDGKLDQFIDLRDVRDTLPLHKLNDKPYYMAAFLVGAYQEILGDLHNLFGDTNVVHVSLDEDGNYNLDHVLAGDTVNEVLGYVEYNPKELIHQIRAASEKAVKQKRISFAESAALMRRYESGLSGYTYLEEME